ncbi:MAG: ABC-2 family transporter protein [Cystobacterineae bacterium]|nr:ABC-2 family transporter protein [Cystobacterineae bacterium]
MWRYGKLFWIQLKASLLLSMQYRADFFVDAVISMFWAATALAPLWVVYGEKVQGQIPGWGLGEAMLVVGCFVFLQTVLEGAIQPSLQTVIEHIRKGTLDFVLLKPADAQFLVSTARFQPWKASSFLASMAIFAVAFARIEVWPSFGNLARGAFLLLLAIGLLYSLWIWVVSAAFVVVKVDNLTFLLGSIFDVGRWPISIFRGFFRLLFTFVIPTAFMTTFPAQALLGVLTYGQLALVVVCTVIFAVVSRWVWLRSIRRYTSASS